MKGEAPALGQTPEFRRDLAFPNSCVFDIDGRCFAEGLLVISDKPIPISDHEVAVRRVLRDSLRPSIWLGASLEAQSSDVEFWLQKREGQKERKGGDSE